MQFADIGIHRTFLIGHKLLDYRQWPDVDLLQEWKIQYSPALRLAFQNHEVIESLQLYLFRL